MAKVGLTKLGLKVNQDTKTITINEQSIEVKQYLPVNDKLKLISNVINNSVDEHNFANPIRMDIYTTLEVLYWYTNISFTEKQKEDVPKLYDLVTDSGLFAAVVAAIPEREYVMLCEGIRRSAEAIYTYRNSVLGILEAVSADYNGLNLDALGIQQTLADPNNMELLKGVLDKLG